MISAKNNSENFKPVSSLNWLFLDLNSYFASVEQQDNPALRARPVAVVPMMTDSTCAIAASYEAKAYGIKTGTKIYEAKKLCPDLICVQAQHDKYVEYHERIFAEVENHIHVGKICSIDEAACELLGSERKRENAIKLAAQIKSGLRKNIGEHIKCSIGIAPNRFLAKIATDMQKPDGLTILEAGRYKQTICALKLTDLTGIGASIERRLNESGIHTIEQLWDLDPKHARQIWGNVGGESFWYRLRGYDIPDKGTKKSVVGHSRVLEPAHRAPDAALGIARQLTLKAALRLRRYDLFARKFSLSIHAQGHIKWGKDTTFTPAQDNFTFISALGNLWQQMMVDTQPQKIQKISITIHDLHVPQDVTLDLFDAAPPPSPKKTTNELLSPHKKKELSNAMDALGKKFGKDAVHLGTCPKTQRKDIDTKIAFTRIPDLEEFKQ